MMELELTEDEINAYHTLPCEPTVYEDDIYVKENLGPNPRNLMVSLSCVTVQYLLMLYMVYQQSNVIYYLLFTFLFGASLGYILLLNQSNPGVLRKNADLQKYLKDAAQATVVMMLNFRFVQRWCADCRIYIPPRVRHCYDCNRCISRYDHHCPWLSNCIGLNNYKLFVLSCFHYFLTMCTSVYFNITLIKDLGFFKGQYFNFDFWVAFAQHEPAITLITIMFCITTFMATYAMAIQTYFIANNVTHYEFAARPYDGINPFNQGFVGNVRTFFNLPFTLKG